jgi:hypothetical protein
LQAAAASVTSVLAADSIETAQPTLGEPDIAQDHALIPTGVTTGQPTAAPAVCVVIVALQADSITTGQPVVGMLFINGSVGRAIHVSEPSNNSAVVTDAPNVCIIAANTPNRVIVAGANEAA